MYKDIYSHTYRCIYTYVFKCKFAGEKCYGNGQWYDNE